MKTEVEQELDKLNDALKQYADFSKLLPEQIIAKQGAKLSFSLSGKLRELAPAKGTMNIGALNNGRGVFIRASVRNSVIKKYAARMGISLSITKRKNSERRDIFTQRGSIPKNGKRMNVQALLVEAELNKRESGSGYLGFGTRMNVAGLSSNKTQKLMGRNNQVLAEAGITVAENQNTLTFVYGGDKVQIGDALKKARFERLIAEAVKETTDDILTYVDRKVSELNK